MNYRDPEATCRQCFGLLSEGVQTNDPDGFCSDSCGEQYNREIAPWWEGRLLDPRDEGQIEKAALVADGKLPGKGPVICPSQSYFGGPGMFHPHPQGWPCFTSCYIAERDEAKG